MVKKEIKVGSCSVYTEGFASAVDLVRFQNRQYELRLPKGYLCYVWRYDLYAVVLTGTSLN